MNFDIFKLLKDLSEKRKIFVSEADFQLELAWLIKEQYPNATVRMEYCPEFAPNMHIDILVIVDDEWIPIELKYRTATFEGFVDDEIYRLKDHSAKDEGCYGYFNDIKRIETIRSGERIKFKEGYAIFLTNYLGYLKIPLTEKVTFYNFSIHQGAEKTGVLKWMGKGKGKEDIELEGTYSLTREKYSEIKNEKNGIFNILINKIEKSE